MNLPIEKILKEKGVAYRLIPLSQEAYTVNDVIRYSRENIDPDDVCKTIILRSRKSDRRIAVFLRGNDKLDFSKLKKILGEEMAIADREQVKEVSGVEPGAVCPFLLSCPLFVDNNVVALKRINCGSGQHLFGLEFEREDLAKGAQYELVDLSKLMPTE
ncbi:MAG: YbaK/EbsC family protein [Candidatus Uhrbacteria bacterium]|nr:YbaK/EbsC family protein [Candidatus Uhrbacteria bacterium]